MRIMGALGTIAYGVSHPTAVQHALRLAALAVGALAHAAGDAGLAHMAAGFILPLGSHWH